MRILTPVTPRQYADFLTLCRDGSRDPLDERGFPGSTGGDVADADDRPIELGGVKGPTTVQRQARARDCVVQDAQWRKHKGFHEASRGAMSLIVRSVAPWLSVTSCLARRPSSSRSLVFESRFFKT